MAKKILNLPTVEELTNKHEEIKEEEIIEDISDENENNSLDIEDEVEDDFVEEPITEELIQEQYEEEYPEQEIKQEVPQRTEYSEEEEAEALEEIVKEREAKKKKPKKLKKNVVIGLVSIVSVLLLITIGYFVVKKIMGSNNTVKQEVQQEVKKQDFENFERLKLTTPNKTDDETVEENNQDTKSGQDMVLDYKLEYPYVDVTLKEDADGQFILMYNKNNTQVLCYSQENQFVGGESKRNTIDKLDPIAEEIVKKIKKYYLNVKVEDNKIIIRSPDEITLDFTYSLLNQWKVVVYLKSLIDRLMELEYPYDTKLVFQTSNPGIVYIEMLDGDTGKYFLEPAHDVPKLFNTNKELAKNLILNLLLKDYDGGCYLNFEDVEDIDCSFLYEVQEFILQKILIDNHKNVHLK